MNQPKFSQAKVARFESGTTIRPLRDRVLVKPIEHDRHCGLHVIEAARKPIRAQVIAVGPGDYRKKYWLNAQGERCKVGEIAGRIPTEVKPGHVVELLSSRYAEVYVGDELHYMCTEPDIAGIIS